MKDFHYIIAISIYVLLSFVLALMDKAAELAGFTVVGALALVFLKLDSFKEFSGAGFSAKLKERVDNLENDIAPIKSKETEPDPDYKDSNFVSDSIELDEDSKNVLDALIQSKYSWRSIGGIKGSSKIRPSQILNTLQSLEKKGLVKKGKSSSGGEIWGATTEGYLCRL